LLLSFKQKPVFFLSERKFADARIQVVVVPFTALLGVASLQVPCNMRPDGSVLANKMSVVQPITNKHQAFVWLATCSGCKVESNDAGVSTLNVV
jgi:hypothetical protein